MSSPLPSSQSQIDTNKPSKLTFVMEIILVCLGIAFIGFAAFKAVTLFVQKEAPKRVKAFTPRRSVQTMLIRNETVPVQISVTGRILATDRIRLTSEVNGRILLPTERSSSISSFKVGTVFAAGDTIMQIDNREATMSLRSKKSTFLTTLANFIADISLDNPELVERWKGYLQSVSIITPLPELPVVENSQEQYFLASKNVLTQYYEIKQQEIALEKYVMIAPFTGSLEEVSVNEGGLVRNGQELGLFVRTGSYEMEASVPVEDITSLNKGSIVECFFADSTTVRGRIVRIGKTIDRTTQTIKVFAQFIASKYSRLRDGMYVSAIVEGKAIEDVARIPRTALVTASEIYTVSTDSTLIRTPVSVERLEGTEAFIRGLQDSTRILSEALVDAREGMKVRFAGKTE